MWDNNNLYQLRFKGNSNTINDTKPKRAVIKGNFLSSSKLHNHKKENNFQIIHHTTKSQRKKSYFSPNISDSSIKNQTIEQQKSILSQSVQIFSSTCIKNIITITLTDWDIRSNRFPDFSYVDR